METIFGRSAAAGLARGKLRVIKHTQQKKPTSDVSRTPEEELARFSDALAEAEDELVSLRERAAETVGTAEADIFEIHRMMMQDEDFTDRVKDGILAGKGGRSCLCLLGQQHGNAEGEE